MRALLVRFPLRITTVKRQQRLAHNAFEIGRDCERYLPDTPRYLEPPKRSLHAV